MPLARCLPYHQTLSYPLCSFHVENTWIAELFQQEESWVNKIILPNPHPPPPTHLLLQYM
jgi:hypothetical protein